MDKNRLWAIVNRKKSKKKLSTSAAGIFSATLDDDVPPARTPALAAMRDLESSLRLRHESIPDNFRTSNRYGRMLSDSLDLALATIAQEADKDHQDEWLSYVYRAYQPYNRYINTYQRYLEKKKSEIGEVPSDEPTEQTTTGSKASGRFR